MRCVSIDFHTSHLIPGIGSQFDKQKFAETFQSAHAQQVLVFAKCHHGYTYYPTTIGTMHPNLNFDLLGNQLDALRSVGIKAPIYITAGWSKLDADAHADWLHMRYETKEPLYIGSVPTGKENPEDPIKDCSWATLCLANPDYLDYMESLTREICERYDVSDGIFYDICFFKDACACESCKKGMLAKGLDPENYEDAKKYYSEKRIETMKRLTGVVHEYKKDAPVFYNGGADMNRTEYHPYQGHFILEDLPTAWGGYDLMPVRAKFFEQYGKTVYGMTAKFHHNWGEFGGFKSKEALKYECADILSVGASIYVGDHMHPSGALDESTYAVIGYAFDYVEKIEKYSENTKAYTDLALWLSHDKLSDIGASKLLQVMHLEYDVIESSDNLSKYACVILPDNVRFTKKDETALVDFAARGGKIIASYNSIFDALGIKKLTPSPFDQDYIRCPVEEYKTPFLAYSSAYQTESDGEALAEVYEPYFSRTFGHYSGHKNTPYKTAPASYPALIKKVNLLYFAHPVFKAYNQSGNYVLERYAIRAISEFYDKMIETEELPSCGRVRLRENKEEKFLALHVLYAPPVNRGNVCLLPDFPKLHDVKVSIKTEKTIQSATLRPDGTQVPFYQENGRVILSLPPFRLHTLITLEYR
ncbi:MAG: alpha-L-fucosidase [Clostridia bacterium]|nr:alpha-L-fucosidase [Clostridia bacterium]